MLQTPPKICAQCNTPISPGQRFCPNCGAIVSETIPPTMAASQPDHATPYNTPFPPVAASQPMPSSPYNMPFPTVAASASPSPEPSNPYSNPYSPIGASSSPSPDPSNPYAPLPSNPGGFAGYNSAPPPPPPSYTPPATLPNNSAYGMPQGFTPPLGPPAPPSYNPYAPATASPTSKKASSPLLIIGIVVAVILVLSGGVWAITRNNSGGKTGTNGSQSTTNGGGGGNNFAASQQLNLPVTYSSDQITFTSLQQAATFSDDTYTTDTYSSSKKNYVRLNFKEQQGERSSYFSYRSSFLLLLPDKSTAAPLKAQEYSGPEQGVVRTNWIDFETKAPLDLSQLSLRLGATDEAQMTIPLKTGADVSKYQPQTATLNKPFNYATMSWTLQKATQSYDFNGKQAKKGKVYVTVSLKANNTGDNTVYFYSGFVRLKSGETVSASEYGSQLDAFDNIDPGTTNVQGTATFLIPPASTYTLEFLAGKGFPAQQVDFSIGS